MVLHILFDEMQAGNNGESSKHGKVLSDIYTQVPALCRLRLFLKRVPNQKPDLFPLSPKSISVYLFVQKSPLEMFSFLFKISEIFGLLLRDARRWKKGNRRTFCCVETVNLGKISKRSECIFT